jgi:tetratricopeptide (TPR) repeat protein
MKRLRKRLIAISVASLAATSLGVPGSGTVLAQTTEAAPEQPDEADLLAQLAEPGREDWQQIEMQVQRLWSRSGSEAMDLLLRRGNEALEADNYAAALEHLTALTDHAPDFAEGWNARATTFYLMEEYALSISDIERTLALNPNHFGALMGLATIFEQLGEDDLALRALYAVRDLNPNRPGIDDAITRLERGTGAADL